MKRMKNLAITLFGCATVIYCAETFRPEKVAPAALARMDAARLARIPAKMKEFVDQGTAAGFVMLVARGGHVASLEAVGFQAGEGKPPRQPDPISRIKSMPKRMTAAGVMILADEARISLLAPVERYLPEYKGIRLNPCGV